MVICVHYDFLKPHRTLCGSRRKSQRAQITHGDALAVHCLVIAVLYTDIHLNKVTHRTVINTRCLNYIKTGVSIEDNQHIDQHVDM